MSSIANFQDFSKQFSEIKNRKASEYTLFVDPYDNEGVPKKFSMSKRQLNSPVNNGRKKAFSIAEIPTGHFDINFSRTQNDPTQVYLQSEEIQQENSLELKEDFMPTANFKDANYLSKVSEQSLENSKQASEK